MFAQTKALSGVEEKANKKFNFAKLNSHYIQVTGDYAYLENLSSFDELRSLFETIINYMNTWHFPQHIEADITSNIDVFGTRGLFE
mmetsp:Transcript_42278/g.40502  ORF Transcript_42278/g.40502 Transcript_42278/m.40502 type:complete len:86 (-) Transcript_42278:82-339(-)